MVGAFIGDCVGASYENDPIFTSDFKLFGRPLHFTDDSVMTLAVMDICYHHLFTDYNAMALCFKKWGRRYSSAGFSHQTRDWLLSDDTSPRNSYGNGAIMDISPIGWYANSEKEILKLSSIISKPLHNHSEGQKAARVISMCIFYARNGKSKDFIKKYASRFYPIYGSLNDMDCSNIPHHNVPAVLTILTCQMTSSLAISAFLLTNSFEECLKTAISCGFDSDTTADVACAIAEAFYGSVNESLSSAVLKLFENDHEAMELLTSSKSKKVFHSIF
jgi:ADP-ribosylglycohydrolase